MFKRLKVTKRFYSPCYCAAHLLLLISLSFSLTFPRVGPSWIYCCFVRSHTLYIYVYSIYSVYIFFVRSKPTFESFCLPSSRHRKWPFLSSDRILLKNLSRRKLGAVNTFAIQGTIKDEVFIVFPSSLLVYYNSLRDIRQCYSFIECWRGSTTRGCNYLYVS